MGIWVKQDFSGDWVKYEDYEKLENENEELKENYKILLKENRNLKNLLEIAPTHIRRKLKELED